MGTLALIHVKSGRQIYSVLKTMDGDPQVVLNELVSYGALSVPASALVNTIVRAYRSQAVGDLVRGIMLPSDQVVDYYYIVDYNNNIIEYAEMIPYNYQ